MQARAPMQKSVYIGNAIWLLFFIEPRLQVEDQPKDLR
jgi:hypothetical protein